MEKSNIMIRLEKKEEQQKVENLVRESFWNEYRPGCLEHYVLHQLRNDPAFVPELDFVLLLNENGKDEKTSIFTEFKTIQYTIDGSCNPRIFSLVSVPNIVGCIGAAIIIIAAIATPIAKSQHMREIWFYVMSGGVMLKIVVMEIARTFAVSYMATAIYELPYEGAKEMLLVEDVDSKEYLAGLFNATYDELPVHKSNNNSKFLLKLQISQNAKFLYMILYAPARILRKNSWIDE